MDNLIREPPNGARVCAADADDPLTPLVVDAGVAVELGGIVLHQGALGLPSRSAASCSAWMRRDTSGPE